ncbi:MULTISPECIES: lytic transglycosylase domain-containing protein [Auritidibacter]|uniref:lytic transglycosylase domain-containing protein n=1 Tax=Auritidibacter TaxID=1160973 RepID=UPI000D73D56C|nr:MULTISPECIES: lytic transglycosylase domain-containing protein [Auritidibacter]AXR73717.1 LysM peptidoglycan-binding domain-containing protein [Auritidibacter sp. NML130574]NIH70356.1 LysM repeat protein [Auritidibacter ignavus]RMX23601.1 LysM peptidoglycan-binding domain-containing protein [Auritidibacter ignavus]WGH82363.1 LysM peptidoglycan-binding domain-containing protein [Auritidibacter ignavus]WGH91557.1 LysM peptidoglycan-binding domain-containing protein [Auritidibacter ignavus]
MSQRASGASRLYTTAIAGTTLPLVTLGSVAAAHADVPAVQFEPKTASPANIASAQQIITKRVSASRGTVTELPASLSSAKIPAGRQSEKIYTVKPGDTLSHIAARNNVSLSQLLRWNPDLSTRSVIYPGQKIKLSGTSTGSKTPSRPATNTKTTSGNAGSSQSSTYTVKRGDTLSGIAARHGVSLSTLLNANGLKTSSIIYPGQKIKLSGTSTGSKKPSRPATNTKTTSGNAGSSQSSTYTVKRGDTLSGIAARHGVSLSTLLNANGLKTSSIIYPGQKIKLSGTNTGSKKPSRPATNTKTTSGNAGSSKSSTYTVKRGDTLSGIAARHGVSLSTLLNANRLKVSSPIYPGQQLKLSGSSKATTGSVGTASGSTNSGSGQPKQLVGNTFLHYTYPDHVVANANANKQALLNAPTPSRAEVQAMVRDTAIRMGVDPKLALAHAMAESSFDATAVSPANAIGVMQVIPSSGEWASQMVGRKLNLLNPQDNITAGIAIIRHLQRTSSSLDFGIASYYQGQAGVRKNGMYPDTKDYVKKVRGYMQRF